MPTAKLTKSVVDGLLPREKPWIMYDTDLKGFGVRVGRQGGKSWIVEYRPGGGGRGVASKRLKIGATCVLTADEARQAAKRALANAHLGSDPAGLREKDRGMPPIKEFSRVFLEDHVKEKRSAATYKTYASHFARLINPVVGDTKLHLLTAKEASSLHLKIGRENGPGAANRAIATLSSMYGYAIKMEMLSEFANPVRKVERYDERFQERYLTGDELASIAAALREAETTGIPWDIDETKPNSKHLQKKNRFTVIDPFAVAALRLLLLTGCRKNEILKLRWDQVDLQRGLLFLPKSKSGKKQVILNSYAVMILGELPRVGPYVVPGRRDDQPRHDLKRPWAAVLKRSGITPARIHDLRHTNASIGVAENVGLPIIGKLLGHLSTETTKRYAHIADDPARRASEAIGLHLFQAMSPAAPPVSRTLN